MPLHRIDYKLTKKSFYFSRFDMSDVIQSQVQKITQKFFVRQFVFALMKSQEMLNSESREG